MLAARVDRRLGGAGRHEEHGRAARAARAADALDLGVDARALEHAQQIGEIVAVAVGALAGRDPTPTRARARSRTRAYSRRFRAAIGLRFMRDSTPARGGGGGGKSWRRERNAVRVRGAWEEDTGMKRLARTDRSPRVGAGLAWLALSTATASGRGVLRPARRRLVHRRRRHESAHSFGRCRANPSSRTPSRSEAGPDLVRAAPLDGPRRRRLVFRSRPRGRRLDLDVVPVSPLLMLRAPLASDEEYPYGRLQPFVGIGPGIFITIVDEQGYSDKPADVGLDLHAALSSCHELDRTLR